MPGAPNLTLAPVKDGRLLRRTRQLIVDYARALDVPPCFQGFNRELATLPGEYAPPDGLLLAAIVDGKAVGCVAIRPINAPAEPVRACEMRRLYVAPSSRRSGLGRALAQAIIDAARSMGYRRMVLESPPHAQDAQAIFESLGFRDIPPYTEQPVVSARHMALEL